MTGAVTAVATFVGVDALTAAAISDAVLTGTAIGGGIGTATDLIEGKGIGKSLIGGLEGAAEGGVSAGLTSGVGESLGDVIGSQTLGQGLVGAASGSGVSAINGSNPLLGAAIGGVGGAISANSGDIAGALGSGSDTTTSPGSSISSGETGTAGTGQSGTSATLGSTSAGSSASAAAAPASATTTTSDITSALGAGSDSTGSSGIDQAWSNLGTTPTTGTLGAGADTSGALTGTSATGASTTGASAAGTTGADTSSFLNGTSAGAANIGQGPTKVNAAGLEAGAGDTTNSILKAYDDPTTGNIFSALGKNVGGIAGLGGVAYNAVESSQKPKGYNQILSEAEAAQSQGTQLESYLSSGNLPSGLQGSLNQALAAQQAQIKSNYAAHGMSGSSAEAQDLANAQTSMASNGANLALKLYQSGLSETQLSSQLYDYIMNEQLSSDSGLSSAISNFAIAASGGSPGVTIKT